MMLSKQPVSAMRSGAVGNQRLLPKSWAPAPRFSSRPLPGNTCDGRWKLATIQSPSEPRTMNGNGNGKHANGSGAQSSRDKGAAKPSTSTKPEMPSFSWTKQWLPVAPLDYLDPGLPASYTILGYNLVVWRDTQGAWRAMDDRCPHRNAPLSEGRLHPITGNLQCSYHGWQFSGSGACTDIPQAPDAKAHNVARASKRSCARAFPTTSRHGLLWVWLESGPQAEQESEQAPVLAVPEMEGEGGIYYPFAKWYMREVPVSFESLLENNGDPSHVFFTHHGVLAKRDDSVPISLHLTKEGREQGVFTFKVEGPAFPIVKLLPPSMLWAGDPEGKAAGGIGLFLAAVPIRPGWSRIMTLPISANTKLRKMAAVLESLTWARHVWNHDVHDGDISVLHRQERYVRRKGGKGWRKDYFLPSQSDTGVITLRDWLDKDGGGSPPWGPDVAGDEMPPEETRREVLLDRWNQHTKHCPMCMKAYTNIQRAIVALAVAAGAAFLMMAAQLGRGATFTSGSLLASGVALALALGARQLLKALAQRFVYADYVHAHHH